MNTESQQELRASRNAAHTVGNRFEPILSFSQMMLGLQSSMPPAPPRLLLRFKSTSTRFSVRLLRTTSSLCSQHKRPGRATNKEVHMQSTNIKEIKAALWRQAFIGDTWVSCAWAVSLRLGGGRGNCKR